MTNIYQQIWDADQQENGLPAITPSGNKDSSRGYVVVDEQTGASGEHVLFPQVYIPEHKQDSYNLCKHLFNNYTLNQTKAEINTPEEDAEVHALLEAVIETKPMTVARQYVAQQMGESINLMRWYQMLVEIWFRQYDQGVDKDLSGFEHAIVGEQSGSKAGGYHFWYKYYLDDGAGLLGTDDITYLGTRYDGTKKKDGKLNRQGRLIPDVVTLAYKWNAYDYETNQRQTLYKPIGGFWVGCSIEGLMALGAVRFLWQARAPKEAIINGTSYALKLYRSQDERSLRTFYPEFLGSVTQPTPEPTPTPAPTPQPTPPTQPLKPTVRIVAALVNPAGNDVGKETITLLNCSPQEVELEGWKLVDKNSNEEVLDNFLIPAGGTVVIPLVESPVQLSNKGGLILLYNQEGQKIDSVSYTKTEVRQQGWTVVF